MPEELLPPGLHVILGDSAAGVFRQVFHPPRERLDVDRDVLSCGPTRACETPEDWDAMRSQFWTAHAPLHEPQPTLGTPERARALRQAQRVTLWVGTGLSEQLSAMFTIQLGGADASASGKYWIVQFENILDGGHEPLGLGVLDDKAMREHPAPRPLNVGELRDYRDLWQAVSAPDPGLIEKFAVTHPRASPWLLRASKLLLRRFPDRASGLNYWDRALLSEVTASRRKAARVVGETIARHWEQVDPVGDFFLFGRLLGLGHADRPKPLLEIFGDGTQMRNTEVQLTPFGLDVLEGRSSNHPANPIEDWASGVRLSSRDGALWFHDGERLVRG